MKASGIEFAAACLVGLLQIQAIVHACQAAEPDIDGSSSEHRPAADGGPSLPKAETKIRLANGTEVPVETWTNPYAAVESLPPAQAANATVVFDCRTEGAFEVAGLAIDSGRQQVYWLAADARDHHGHLCRAQHDGSDRRTLVDGLRNPQGLRVVPSLKLIYWISRSQLPGRFAIYRCNLDGQDSKVIIDDLPFLATVVVDPGRKQLYWKAGEHLRQSDLDGGAGQDLFHDKNLWAKFAIDLRGRRIFFLARREQPGPQCDLVRANLDGSDRTVIRSMSIQADAFSIDPGGDYLYWFQHSGIVRAHLDALQNEEQITETSRITGYCPWYALDVSRGKIYWALNSRWTEPDSPKDPGQKIVVSDLPGPWRTMSRPAPPQIHSLIPAEGPTGADVKVEGTGFATARNVFWTQHLAGLEPKDAFANAPPLEGKFKAVSDTALTVTVPNLEKRSSSALLIVSTDGGVTVTLPRNLAVVNSRTRMQKGDQFKTHGYLIAAGGCLDDLGKSVVLIAPEGTANESTVGQSAIFVKNGGSASLSGFRSIVFFEPFARLHWPKRGERLFPVAAIRPSFVEGEFKIRPSGD